MGEVHDLHYLLAVRVRIFPAGPGPVLVNKAIVVTVQERTRSRFENIVVVVVNAEELTDKITRPHSQSLRKAFDIVTIEYRARRFAAIRAGQAIKSLEHRVVRGVENLVYSPRIFLLQAGQELPVFRTLVF